MDGAGEVLGMGMTKDLFHWDGKEPVEMERLKMCQAVNLSRREGMPSGPGDVRVGREIRRETEVGEQRSSSLQTSEGSNGTITRGIGSTVKKTEKA